MTLQITDKFGRVVPFSNNAEMNYQFVIEREIIVPSNEERVKAMSEYNRFKSFWVLGIGAAAPVKPRSYGIKEGVIGETLFPLKQ